MTQNGPFSMVKGTDGPTDLSDNGTSKTQIFFCVVFVITMVPRDRVLSHLVPSSNSSETQTKMIIHWTDWYFGRAPDELSSQHHCGHLNIRGSCIMTTNRSQYMVRVYLMETVEF